MPEELPTIEELAQKLKSLKKSSGATDLFDRNARLFKSETISNKKFKYHHITIKQFRLMREESYAKVATELRASLKAISVTDGRDSEIFKTLRAKLMLTRQLLRVIRYEITVVREIKGSRYGSPSNTKTFCFFAGEKSVKKLREIKNMMGRVDDQLRQIRHMNKKLSRRMNALNDNGNLAYLISEDRTDKDTGVILALQKTKKIHHIFVDKKPTTPVNHVGVELEFCAKADKNKLATALFEAGIIKYCSWHNDQSLRPHDDEIGHELSILAPEDKITVIVSQVCDVLAAIGAETVERRCGMHVHFDMRNRDKTLVYNNLVACQRWLIRMVAPSRRNGEFCKSVKSRKFPSNFTGEREERYKSINAAAFYKHQTLEIRLHEGVTDATLINNWIKFLLKIVRYRKVLPKNTKSLRDMFTTFNMNDKIQEYARDRIHFHKVNNPRPRRAGGGLRAIIDEDVAPHPMDDDMDFDDLIETAARTAVGQR